MSAAFWNRIAELEARVGELTERLAALETAVTSMESFWTNTAEPKRPPGRPRKVEDSAA